MLDEPQFVLRSTAQARLPYLATTGLSVVHADADALFMRDPTPLLAEGDIVASRIWGKPLSVVRKWGAGVCTGFYFLRSSNRTTSMLKVPSCAVHSHCLASRGGLNRFLAAPRTLAGLPNCARPNGGMGCGREARPDSPIPRR